MIYVVDGNGYYVIDGATAVGIIGNSDDLIGAYGMLEVKVGAMH